MDITQPEFIPVPWAANGQKASIPEEQTSAGNGRASWKTGFPTENTLPVSQGGVPANYQDFQGVLYSLSKNVCYQQAGGMFTWSATIDYQNGARVLGSDGKAYISTGKTGPSTTVVNPVGDTSGKWILDANMAQVSSAAGAITQDYVTSGGYTVSGDVTYGGDVTVSGTVNGGGVVHIVGNETISGTKTFASTISGNITGSASYATSAGQATKLTTARTVQTNLGATTSATFDGTANIAPGVTGTLAVANGGTGVTAIADIQAGKDGAGNTITDTYVEQTVYEAAIENLDETKAGKDTVAVNTKSIANIQSLLNGALSTQQSDTDTAYTKTVPQGAQPWAAVQEVGGKTVCWNQLGRYGGRRGTKPCWGTTDNLVTAETSTSMSVTETNSVNYWVSEVLPDGHKVFTSFDIVMEANGTNQVQVNFGGNVINTGVTLVANVSSHIEVIGTQNGASYKDFYVYSNGASGTYVAPWTISNFQFIDLTLLYGSGNEPTTVAEFRAQYPDAYYAYDAGSLKSAAVTGAVSDPHNIAIPSVINATSNHAYLDADIIRRHFISPGDCLTVYVYKMSDGTSIGNECALAFWKDSTQLTSATASPNRHIYFQSGAQGGIDVNLASLTPDYNKVSLYIGASAKNIDLGVVIVAGATTITQYIPSRAPVTLPIPSAVQSLPGYGWSAGTAYNEVDWANKKYIQRVGSVDLGTLTWTYLTSPVTYFVANISTMVSNTQSVICSAYVFSAETQTIANVPDKSTMVYGKDFRVRDSAYTSAADFKSAMSGVMLYYELDTPIETDISDLLSDDNLIEVEPGGTVSFPSSLGDDYRLPVPSDVEYTIDLAPDAPSTDGTYTLQCTVADGVATYSWVSA